MEKRKIKRLLSAFVCIALIFTALPLNFGITASAETEGIYTYTVTDGEATITDCDNSVSGDIIIPSTLGGYDVTQIGNLAFYDCDSLTSITIPDSVTSIGFHAFGYNHSLKSITISDSVTSIDSFAFEFCYSLTSINVDVDNTVYTSLNGILFNRDKTTLICYPAGKTDTSYIIPDSVTSIGNVAFEYNWYLKSVTIPNSVTSIGGYAFGFCYLLTNVTITDSITSIGRGALLIQHGTIINRTVWSI